jgi:hypothetical protein
MDAALFFGISDEKTLVAGVFVDNADGGIIKAEEGRPCPG